MSRLSDSPARLLTLSALALLNAYFLLASPGSAAAAGSPPPARRAVGASIHGQATVNFIANSPLGRVSTSYFLPAFLSFAKNLATAFPTDATLNSSVG